MVLKRRRDNGAEEIARFSLELLPDDDDLPLTEEEVNLLLLDLEIQANGTVEIAPRQPVRVWLHNK